MRIDFKAGFAAIGKYLRFTVGNALQPRFMALQLDLAEYVQSLFLADTPPEQIGRMVDKMYGRRRFRFFKVWDDAKGRFDFPEEVDYGMDGLEYVNAAMIKLGALEQKRDGTYYNTGHPMVQHLAKKMQEAPLPAKKGAM